MKRLKIIALLLLVFSLTSCASTSEMNKRKKFKNSRRYNDCGCFIPTAPVPDIAFFDETRGI